MPRDERLDSPLPIYHWFTAGFDTADLQEAKALLDELEEEVGTPLPLIQTLSLDIGLLDRDIADKSWIYRRGVVAEHHHVGTFPRF